MSALNGAVIDIDTAPDPEIASFYRECLETLNNSGIPFLVGGTYALSHYTGIIRHTKDLDIFVRPADSETVLGYLAAAGYETEITFPHWLGKAFGNGAFVDVIFRSGNGLCIVDDAWFEHAVEAEVVGVPVRLCPAEEMIWSASFVQERERFDGADIIHLLRARGNEIDWRRLMRRFGRHWRVLLGHLVMFGYVYPTERQNIPAQILEELMRRLHGELRTPAPGERVCRGTLLSRAQYLVDIEEWGYQDPRLLPGSSMTEDDVAVWTEAIPANEVAVPEAMPTGPDP
jgi:hypothetical protein